MPAEKYKTSPRTKKLLVKAIMELAETMPVSKIKITDICEKAELNRQSFYYHFRDKYDLIAWAFLQEFQFAAENSKVLNSEEMMCAVLKRIEQHKKFYKNAYEDTNQNNLSDYEVKMYLDMEFDALRKYYKTEELDPELVYNTKSYSYACIMHTREWITDREKMPAEIFAHRMYRDMPEEVKKAFEAMK